MQFVFWVLGILCFLYYGVIVVYSGFFTSFAYIWIIFGALCILAGIVCRVYPSVRRKVPLRLEVGVITLFSAGVVIFAAVEILIGISSFTTQKQSADYAIVPGAQFCGDTPGRTLTYRLDEAVEYARIHPNTIIILSGGRAEGEDRSEADVMYDYLAGHGVPEYQMIKEDRSTNTYENMLYSKAIIDGRERERRAAARTALSEMGYEVPPDSETSINVAIITSNFHVMRAKGIAEKLGIPNISAIAVSSDPVLFVHNCVRECFAILKDKFLGHI